MELTASDLWLRVLESARSGMPEQSFRTWLSGTRATGLTEDEIFVDTPSTFHTEWVEDKFGAGLAEVASRIVGRPMRLVFSTAPDGATPHVPAVELSPSPPDIMPGVRRAPPPGGATPPGAAGDRRGSGQGSVQRGNSDDRPYSGSAGHGLAPDAGTGSGHGPGHGGGHAAGPSSRQGSGMERRADAGPGTGAGLNERYTFDRFVVGTNNQLAAAASHAVAETPARIYNPLFIYGGVGLGKTHLMHAVGHEILSRHPERRVAYVSAERFMNELVNAIQTGTTGAFRRHYRQIDLLLVDDIHFLVKKESTQEEFFHTFNTLYDAGKQIILTSDRAPKDLPGVEERLVSRFEWGLVVDIKPPDYETRVAILRKKADDDGLALDDEVIDFIARSCTSSVRELEGAVIKLLAYSSLRREEVTEELARAALRGMLRNEGPAGEAGGARVTPELIRERVAAAWSVRPEGLQSRRRTKDLTVPRQVAMFLIKELLDESLVAIGRVFGGRDHSTVIHSIRKVEEDMETDEDFAERVREVRNGLER
jgi:chromosomal replication initiator protein